jgi:hypothetical protein
MIFLILLIHFYINIEVFFWNLSKANAAAIATATVQTLMDSFTLEQLMFFVCLAYLQMFLMMLLDSQHY